mgnify:CR=1 FL=1
MVAKSQKRLNRLTIGMLKVIPMLLALISLLNSTLSFFGIDLMILSYIGCTSLLSLAFLYLASYCFGFCEYHRMFLHYVVINDLLSIYDYHIGIPVSDIGLFLIHIILTGVALYLILYMHQKQKHVKCFKGTSTKDCR